MPAPTTTTLPQLVLLSFLCAVFVASCDDDPIQPIIEEDRGVLNPACTAYPTDDLGFSSATTMTAFGSFIVTGGINEIKVVDANSSRVVTSYEEVQLQVRDFTGIGGQLFVCGIKGIFTVDLDGTITKVSDEPCSDLLFEAGELLFVSTVGTLGPDRRAAANVKVLDRNSFAYSFYTDSNYVADNHFPRRLLMFQDQLFVLTSLDNENRVITLENREVAQILNPNNAPELASIDFWLPPSNTELFVWEDQLWLFTYNGPSKFLLRLENGVFNLAKSWTFDNRDVAEEDITFSRAFFNRIQPLGNDLAISTSEGLALLSLSADGETVSLRFVTDPLLPSNNWVAFLENNSSITHVLTNYQFLTEVMCR